MKYIYPDYDNSLLSLISSIENYYGIENKRKTLKMVDEALKNDYKNIIVVLYDGFGYNILKKNKDITPFLNKNLKCNISSVFPPTTTAATTSVITGLSPVEHGWLGWDMYMKKYDSVVTLFLNCEKESGAKIEDYPGTKNILKTVSVMKKISKIDGCLGSGVSPFGSVSYKDIDEMNDNIVEITKNDKKNYIYAYYDDPDGIMHEYGTDSTYAKEKFKLIDKKFEELCNRVNDSLVIMIADHGHINISDWITLTDYPSIINLLKGTTGIDSRAASFRLKEGKEKEFEKEIKKVIKDDFLLLNKEEIIQNKVFGDGIENQLFKDGIGDYMAIAISDKAIRYSDKHGKFKSSHAGITEDEVYVPLVMVNKK